MHSETNSEAGEFGVNVTCLLEITKLSFRFGTYLQLVMSGMSQPPRYEDEEYESEWELSDDAREQVELLENPQVRQAEK